MYTNFTKERQGSRIKIKSRVREKREEKSSKVRREREEKEHGSRIAMKARITN